MKVYRLTPPPRPSCAYNKYSIVPLLARERVTKLMEYQNQLMTFETLSSEERNRLMAEYSRHLDDHLAELREYQTAQNGVKEAIDEYAVSAGNAFDNAKNFMSNTLDSMEDALVNSLTTGKGGWKAMVQSMIADFMRLMVIRPMLAKFWSAMGLGQQSSSPDLIGVAINTNAVRSIHARDLDYLKNDLDTSHLNDGDTPSAGNSETGFKIFDN